MRSSSVFGSQHQDAGTECEILMHENLLLRDLFCKILEEILTTFLSKQNPTCVKREIMVILGGSKVREFPFR